MASLLRRIGISNLLLLCLLPLCLLDAAQAQTTGTIEGVISDIQGGVIQGAAVVVTNTATTIARTVTTDAGGRYQVGQLIPGPYTISAVSTGFKKTVLSGITLMIAQTLEENITEQIADAQGEVINVTAEPLTTDTETSSAGEVIDNAKVEELPLANRQFYELAQIAPGVLPPAQASTLGFRGGFNVNGAPETDNQFLVNGTFNNDMGTNQPSFRPSVETIGEFKMLTGVYSADYGRFAGGQIVMITKQGTNKFHGSLYEFIRNGAIEAKPWSSTPQTLTPAFKQNTFGGTIGGPVIRDRAFFFFGYEGQRIRQQIVASSTVPTPAILGGCLPSSSQLYNPFTGALLAQLKAAPTTGGCANIAPGTTSTGAIIPEYDITGLQDANLVSLWNTPSQSAQLSRSLIGLAYPAQNTNISAANVIPSNNYNFSETRQETMDEYNTRGDFKYSERDSFSGTWNYFHDPSFEPMNSLCSSRTLPNFGCFTNQLSTLANVAEVHIFKPNLINEVRFGFSRLVQPRVQQDNTTIGAQWAPLLGQLGQTAVPNNFGVPSISVTGFTATGGQTNLPQDRWTNHFQFTDAITWIRGPHTFKFGFDMTDVKSTEYEVTTGRGSLTFSNSAANTNNANPTAASSPHYGTTEYSMGDMLLGLPSSTSVDAIALPYTYNRFSSFDFFVMDDWKVTPTLTLNLGVRYEINNPVSEKYGNMATFNINAPNPFYVPGTSTITTKGVTVVSPLSSPTGAFITAKQNGVKTVYQTDRHSFAPRIGFAWQPLGNEKTVVKGAFGTFFQEPILYNEFLSYSLQYPIRTPYSFISGPVNQTPVTGQSIASSPTVLALSNPFNSSDLPSVNGGAYCPAGSSTTAGACAGSSASGCPGTSGVCNLTPVISGTYINPKYGNPYWDEWSFSIQRQINRTTLVEVGYYGSKGSQISGNGTLNYTGTGPNLANVSTTVLQGERVFPNWGGISEHKTGFNSEYESMPVRLEERTKSGASILFSYTYGKSLDETTSAQNPDMAYVDPQTGRAGSQKGDRGLSGFNVKHRFVLSPVYPLPFGKGQMWLNQGGIASAIAGGWKISGVFQYFTGRPLAIADTSVSSGINGGGDRPNFTSNPNASVDPVTNTPTHTAKEWFNIHAFDYNDTATATPYVAACPSSANPCPTGARVTGTFGNGQANSIIGPGWDEIDLTVGRTFAVTERANVEVKVDGFNIANHPNFLSPSGSFNGTYNSGGFGAITAANNMRELQASLHITF